MGGQITSVCNQPPKATQPSALSMMGNEYWTKCGDAVRLNSKGRHGIVHSIVNIRTCGVASKSALQNNNAVASIRAILITERLK